MGNCMKINILIPNKINVGYRKCNHTYTGQLGFVTYFDHEDRLCKEQSWNDWRNPYLGNHIYENKPLSGFVLNKNEDNNRCYNMKHSHIIIYDPRGFEFEITIENLLYILRNTNCINRKLEDEFVFGWMNGHFLLTSAKKIIR